jgi:glycosyltransferase involved in cell wall biosynthesis
MPIVSIYMAMYNNEKYLAETLDSILAQTFKDFELIITDDGSSDNSLVIAKDYAKRDNRIRVLSFPHRGQTATRNEAVKYADPNSKYLMNHDSDDISFPVKIERLVKYLEEHPEIAAVGCFAECFDDEGNLKGQYRGECKPEKIRETFGKANPMIHSATLFRREVFNKIGGYNNKFQLCEDYDFFARALMKGFNLANIPDVLHRVRLHPKSLTSVYASSLQRVVQKISRNYRFYQFIRGDLKTKLKILKNGLR